jgi:NDP-sugar pyrophosphorylase family protein
MIKPYPMVILCGGEGTRIRMITKDEIPKSMIKVNGRPFVEHQLELFAKKGIQEATLLVGKMGGAIESYLDQEYAGIKLKYIYDHAAMYPGTGSALINAYHDLPPQFILTYGDSYLDFTWPDVIFYNPFISPILMTVYKNEGKHFPSNVELNSDGEIVAYNNHPAMSSHAMRMKYVECGLLYVNKSALCYRLKRGFDETLCELTALKMIRPFVVDKRPYEIGVPSGIHELEAHLASSSCAQEDDAK